ncbi:hypothetical protein J1P25_18220 [Pseudomonas stutzeri]|nr:hypothetical protein [Stutzerimonas stutzeri]MBO0643712.1 hypothetical protein [Stutzerimonas stutzeri]
MNIEQLATQHLDALLEVCIKQHREHIEVLERALAGDSEGESDFACSPAM